MTILAAYEWHRMVARASTYRVETAVTAVSVAHRGRRLLLDAQRLARLDRVGRGRARGSASGGPPRAKSLLAGAGRYLSGVAGAGPCEPARISEPRGALVIVGLFLIVWATDTGALIFGNLIGGPRLAPKLSPSKTWAGTIGGSVTAALVFGLLYLAVGRNRSGSQRCSRLFFSVIAHAGDLFESFVKRRFGIKNSGALIPGHGGVLDRMDSTFSASVALALLVFLAHFNPLFGVAS